MRKLFLTSFTGKSEDKEFTETRLVALNVNKGDDDRQNTLNANSLVCKWFRHEHPNCTLEAIYTTETISEDYFKPQQVETIESLKQSLSASERFRAEDAFKSLVDAGKRFYSINDHEGLEMEDGYSKDVLIDLDGNKKNFRVGWLDVDDETGKNKWCLYGDGKDTIDMKHAVYTKLDF